MSINLNDIITYGNAQFKVVKIATSKDINDLSKQIDNIEEIGYIYIYISGNASNPGNISYNSRYVLSNPFPGYCISAKCELLINNTWCEYDNLIYVSDNHTQGLVTSVMNNQSIIIQTGKYSLCGGSIYDENPFNKNNHNQIAPCRVKVYKNGKI